MESKIFSCNFRCCGDKVNGGVISMIDSGVGSNNSNCNNLHISHNTFGLNSGSWIESKIHGDVDVIWIDHNKFELDSIPSNPNTSTTPLIVFPFLERVFISDNSFTYFNGTQNRNYYGRIIEVGSGDFGTVNIYGNMFHGCDCTLLFTRENGVSCYCHDNYSVSDNDMIIENNSSKRQQLELPKNFRARRIKPTVYNIITSHNFINNKNIQWVKDDASLDVAKSCVYMDSAYVSFVRIPFKYLKAYGNSENIATVKVRAKLASSGGNPLVFYDGNTGSRAISITNTDWEWISYTYESLTSESESAITIANNNRVLIDAIAIY